MLETIFKELNTGIEKASAMLSRDLSKIRTGRATAGMLDSIRVDYYGVPTPIHQMATVSVPEPRLITVKPWERGQIKAIEKALRDSDLGLTPQSDGDLIRISIPALTEDRRREMVKLTKKFGEESKVAIRKYSRDANEMIEQLGSDEQISEDDAVQARKKIEDFVAEGNKKIIELIAAKEKEILAV
ncbi:MAG: ribosome recycling factor [Anaerolineae bacterium]|nr:ribosome recycling factor [Anaerolineae bacterium]